MLQLNIWAISKDSAFRLSVEKKEGGSASYQRAQEIENFIGALWAISAVGSASH